MLLERSSCSTVAGHEHTLTRVTDLLLLLVVQLVDSGLQLVLLHVDVLHVANTEGADGSLPGLRW